MGHCLQASAGTTTRMATMAPVVAKGLVPTLKSLRTWLPMVISVELGVMPDLEVLQQLLLVQLLVLMDLLGVMPLLAVDRRLDSAGRRSRLAR